MEYVCIEYNLVMYKKAHVKKIEDESLLYHWVDDVLHYLKEINYENIIQKIKNTYNKKQNIK